MKEIPILFSTPMVQVILEGRKTMTRRIVKQQLPKDAHGFHFLNDDEIWKERKIQNTWSYFTDPQLGSYPCDDKDHFKCKYGQTGDVLWVRETFIEFPEGQFNFKDKPDPVFEQAKTKWKPSIHMRKSAARIWLQVEEIRVERLQDISEEDMISEGVLIPVSERNTPVFVLGTANSAFSFLPDGCLAEGATPPTKMQILFAFWAELWCKINGRKSWDANPWVWVVKYKVLSTTGKPQLANLSTDALPCVS